MLDNNMSLKEQAEEIKKMAEEKGLEDNFFFLTTFDRYLVQIDILESLKEEINDEGTTVSKEYVKGRKNLYTNPAINAYNRTTDSANKTVSTLLKILNGAGAVKNQEEVDPLVELIAGGDSIE
jgi:hypothetical protein|nr:MAG TPA: terminase small subunit [Caudoviricetes sp.]